SDMISEPVARLFCAGEFNGRQLSCSVGWLDTTACANSGCGLFFFFQAEDGIRDKVREGQEPFRSRPHRDAKRGRGDDRDPCDQKADPVRRELKAPGGGVRAATVELMEDRPHLSRDRGEAAEELCLER